MNEQLTCQCVCNQTFHATETIFATIPTEPKDKILLGIIVGVGVFCGFSLLIAFLKLRDRANKNDDVEEKYY
jgi:hypothetical protein